MGVRQDRQDLKSSLSGAADALVGQPYLRGKESLYLRAQGSGLGRAEAEGDVDMKY
jgi:hypothetical protein